MTDSYVVVDCETTGFGKSDRIVEVAAVVLEGPKLEIAHEFDTLVNPMRDTGPVNIHGVTASMVEMAPTFKEVASALANVLHGRVFVAHNLAFDTRMLTYEFERQNADFDFGSGICTLRATKKALTAACEHYKIKQEGEHHRALADARNTARLFQAAVRNPAGEVCRFAPLPTSSFATVRREFAKDEDGGFLPRLLSTVTYPSDIDAEIEYLNMVDWCLDDAVITSEERETMMSVAADLGLSVQEVVNLHKKYFQVLVDNAKRDGVITKAENKYLQVVADDLSIAGSVSVPEITEIPSEVVLMDGMGVCFTGSVVLNGEVVDREFLETLAVERGLHPLGSVTKKHCDLLVAADNSSMSNKAKSARKFGIPVISVEEFLDTVK